MCQTATKLWDIRRNPKKILKLLQFLQRPIYDHIVVICVDSQHVYKHRPYSSNPSSRKNLDLTKYGRPYKVLLLACAANCIADTILAIT